MRTIVKAESRGNQYAVNNNPKTKDLSYGLVQINKYTDATHKDPHPDVSIVQAFSPAFALNFLASALASGSCAEWTTCPIKGGNSE